MKFSSQFLLVSILGFLAIAAFATFKLPSLLGQPREVTGLSEDEIRTWRDNLRDKSDALLQETSLRTATVDSSEKKLVSIEQFLRLLRSDTRGIEKILEQVEQNWDISYVPMMLEVGRFLQPSQRALVLHKLETKTGQKFGADFDGWMQWNWRQKYEQHPEYASFKAILYSKIDPRFAEYFVKTEGATIRLDEVRWGGVIRDGIPPLKNPKMLTVAQADYLSDTDVVFGIELNGDARCYPKRILAWHEMFKDTIGGESVCGVY